MRPRAASVKPSVGMLQTSRSEAMSMSGDNNVAAATHNTSSYKNVPLNTVKMSAFTLSTSRSFPCGVRREARTSVSLEQGMWRNMQLSFHLNMTQWVALLLWRICMNLYLLNIHIELRLRPHGNFPQLHALLRDCRSVDSSHCHRWSGAFPRTQCQA